MLATNSLCALELTILEDVQPSEDVIAEEVFGPVCTLQRFSSFSEAVDMVNSSQFGLQSGVFTRDINKAFYAYNNLEVVSGYLVTY